MVSKGSMATKEGGIPNEGTDQAKVENVAVTYQQ